jgi:hypothetical protein
MIIHVSGAPASGKTILGKKIQIYFQECGSNVIVKDLDNVLMTYKKTSMKTNEWNSNKYQEYLDKLLLKYKNTNKVIVLVGLNKDMGQSNIFYNINADYKFYIKIPIKKHLEQAHTRELSNWLNWMQTRDHKILFNQILGNEKQVIKDLTQSLSKNLSLSKLKKEILIFDKLYETKKYIFLTSNKIYDKIIKLNK